MGRASRRWRELLEPPKSEAERLRRTSRYAQRAQRRASKRGASIAEYEAMAEMGSKYVLEALIARSNARMLAANQMPAEVECPSSTAKSRSRSNTRPSLGLASLPRADADTRLAVIRKVYSGGTYLP